MTAERVVVIGAGVGGLVAALELAHRGCDVTLCERAAAPGGKMREVSIGRAGLDAGPTVLTMRWIFDQLFADLGLGLDDYLQLRQADCLARHAWSDTERLDLFADLEKTVDAIGDFAGAGEARRFRRFSAQAQNVYRILEDSFIGAAEPSMLNLLRHAGLRGLGDLLQIKPYTPLWRSLGTYFRDPRLRQLFGRYATYCGSSPFLAPAMLKLVAHVEQRGVWLIDGGMHRLAQVLAKLGASRGVGLRYRCGVERICLAGDRVEGVVLAGGERLDADAVVFNADPAALAAGLFGADAAGAAATVVRPARSLSALTWNLLAPA